MSLASELGYSYPTSVGRVRSMTRALVASRPGAWMARRVLHRLDRWVFRLTSQRSTLSSLLSGLPVLMLTTTGAKSGLARTVPLLGIPMGDEVAIIGSNFGQPPTPGWVHNLLADPKARVAYRDRAADVVARIASGDLVDAAFEVSAKLYPGYANYRQRVAHREIRVFVFESA